MKISYYIHKYKDCWLINFIISIILLLLINTIFNLIGVDFYVEGRDDQPFSLLFFQAILLAPLLETLFFQVLPIEFVKVISKDRDSKAIYTVKILVSAISFSLVHLYSLGYFLFAFICGVVFAYNYIVYRYSRSPFESFLLVSLLHATYNLISFI